MDVYIWLPKKVKIDNKELINIGDIAKIECDDNIKDKIEHLPILSTSGKNETFFVTVIQIVGIINRKCEDVKISNLGENDMIVEYVPERKGENKFYYLLKIVFICIVLFAGASTAIMAFHTETQLIEVLSKYYEIFKGEKLKNPLFISIPYTFGVGVGIVTFFNHFGSKNLTNDPTPVEVEMTQYESQIVDTVIDKLNSKEGE